MRWAWLRNPLGHTPRPDDEMEMGPLEGLYPESAWMNNVSTFAFLHLYRLRPGVDADATPIIQTLAPPERVYLQHLFRAMGVSNSVQHGPLWENGAQTPPATQQMLGMLTEVLDYVRLVGDVSIDGIVRHLASKGIFDAGLFSSPEVLEAAHRAIFVVVGGLTMLYTTVEDTTNTTLRGLQVVVGSQRDSPTTSRAVRALSEYLRGFGDILPQNSPTTLRTELLLGFNANEGLLLTANLSLATICEIARLEIQWVLCIGEHLTLDLGPDRQRLKVFALPSFCNVSKTDLSPFARISDAFYEEWMKPQGMLGSKYVLEVLHTLLILLGTDKSRKLFKTREVSRIKSSNFNYDPAFKLLYDALRHKRITLKDTYSKTTDFPILAHRLERLEEYVNTQQPNRLIALWKDDRDIMRWYTLWVVIFLGIFASALGIFQVGVGVFQAVYAKKAYDFQIKYPPSNTGV